MHGGPFIGIYRNSWKLFGQISREEGMQRYIALITELCPDWNVTAGVSSCPKLL